MADFRKLAIATLLADGKIDDDEVKALRKELYEDGKIDKKEVEFLIELRNAAQKKVSTATTNLNRAVVQLANAAPAAQNELIVQGIAIQASMPGLRAVPDKKTVEFQHQEDVKVRTMILPEQFDDKGNLKEYTRAEKQALKGKDKKLPGYESSVEKLEAGQKLRVVLRTVKKPTEKDKDKEKGKAKANDPDKEKAKANDPDKDIDKDKDADADADKKKQVKLIVILEEAPDNAPKGKKKKNE